MRATGIRPRLDQVAELTRGVELPLRAMSEVHLEVVAEGLIRAFEDIQVEEPGTVACGSEAEVTALMESRLNRLIEQDCLLGQLVLCVARGRECISFDGSHLEKRPDLSIYLSDRARGFPLIAEAKVLDAATGKTQAKYCEQGVRRFVSGEYAWGCREAFMIGYVRDGSSIETTLTPFLSIGTAERQRRYLVERLPVAVGDESRDLARSRHGRDFFYCQPSPASRPGPIEIWHLWVG